MGFWSGTAARSAHVWLTAVLVLILVGNPGGRRRSRAGYREFVTDFQTLDAVMRRVAPPLFLGTIAAGVAAAAATARRGPAGAALRALSAGLVAAAVRSTLTVNEPVNSRMRAWHPDTEPPDWREQRSLWERGHRVRTALVVAAALAVVTAGRR